MSLPFSAIRTDFSGAGPARALWLKRTAGALLPLVLLLLWTLAVRLPFFVQTDKDEFFFSVIAAEWLKGGLPYVATFDVKPPGLFFIYAVVQSLLGASQATIKGMEIVAVTLAGYGLYTLVRANGTRRAAFWVAVLFPIYTVTLAGTVAANMILQLPFLVWGFVAALNAVREGSEPNARLRQALCAGLAIGAAGMVKQTAIFEAVAVFAVLCIYGERRLLLRLCGLFVLGAGLPAVAFGLYFLAAGHFHEMFEAVIALAMQRTDSDVLAGYGPEAAYYFTFAGTLQNVFAPSVPLIVLWGGALFAALRFPRLKNAFPARLLIVAGLWLAASLAGVLVARGLCTYYLLAIVPPLLVLAAAFFCHGLDVAPAHASRAFALSIVAAIASVIYVDRHNLFWPDAFLAGDYQATRRVSEKILALGLRPQDRLLVLNRGLSVYTETGALPPTLVFHPTHLLGVFHTPLPDALGAALAADPRFIVIADANVRHITELASRYERALGYVAAHYRAVITIAGDKDNFTIYEFAG